MLVAGDTVRGMAEMEAGLRAAGYSDPAILAGQYPLLPLVRRQAMRPETRTTGIPALRWHLAHAHAPLFPLLTLWLAEALDAAGEVDEARRHYARFAVMWAEPTASLNR